MNVQQFITLLGNLRCSQRILSNYNNIPSTSGICFAHFSARKAKSYNILYFKLFYINSSQHSKGNILYLFLHEIAFKILGNNLHEMFLRK